MTKFDISFIMPVYNTDDSLLTAAINSVLAQKANFELIIIDDGSNQHTADYLDTFMQLDNRIKVLHDENQGVSKARNHALNIVQGEYVAFIDADDRYVSTFAETALPIARANNLDALFGRWCYQDLDLIEGRDSYSKKLVYMDPDNSDYFKASIFDRTIIQNLDVAPFSFTCCYAALFYAKSLESIRFKEKIKISEDNLFIWDFLSQSNSVAFLDDIVYIRERSNNSATRSTRVNALEELTNTSMILYKLAENSNDFLKKSLYKSIFGHFCSISDYTICRKDFYSKIGGSKTQYMKKVIQTPVFKETFKHPEAVTDNQKIICNLALKGHALPLVIIMTQSQRLYRIQFALKKKFRTKHQRNSTC